MPDVAADVVSSNSLRLNVADRLSHVAAKMPDAIAVVCTRRSSRSNSTRQRGESGSLYEAVTFAQLDAEATRLANGFINWGVPVGTRLALLVQPGIEFVALVFALLRAGMVIVLVDPGIGRKNLARCLADAKPEGFVAVSMAQAARLWYRTRFPQTRWNVTVGRRWFWGGLTLDALRNLGNGQDIRLPDTSADDAAAIIFTSGSTGPPKGVLYTHRMFDAQVAEIQSTYGIEAGGVDLACFPLFALFNSAMGVTTVFPEMDFSRPASADPGKLLAAANDWRVTQAFASPAVWRVLSRHYEKTGERIPSLRQVFSCGAPVSADVLRATLQCVADGATMHTPYGATECLPVATIEATEVLGETAVKTDEGAGVCVGRKFDSIEWRVIRISDDPIATIGEVEELPAGEIGELVVRGPQASSRYVTRTECNAQAKINDERAGRSPAPHGGEDAPARTESQSGTQPWHRMGDVGYLDDKGRFWYCGRKSQRVETKKGTLFTECVEAVANTHPDVRRCALVGVRRHDRLLPVLIVEREKLCISDNLDRELLRLTSSHADMGAIADVLWHAQLPVDVRHNAKIRREELAEWATWLLSTGRVRNQFQPPAPSP